MNWIDETMTGRVEVSAGERISIVLKSGSKSLAQASVYYRYSDDKRWAHYCIPCPSSETLRELKGSLNICLENELNTVIKEVLLEKLLSIVDKEKSKIRFIEKLAPSYGFIGGALNQPLLVSVNRPITKVKIQLREENYLNFSSLSFIDSNEQMVSKDAVSRIAFSSSKASEVDLHSLSNSGFHSELEMAPWLEVEFNQPQAISAIRFVNRQDKWGIRSKNLLIQCVDTENRLHHLHDNTDEAAKLALFDQLQLKFGQANFHVGLSRAQTLGVLLAYFNSTENVYDLDEADIDLIPCFLSAWASKKPNEEEARLELKLLAIYLCHFMKVQISLNIMCFESLLNNRLALKYLEEDINEVRERSGLELIEITKHGTALASKLTSNPALFVESLKTLIEDLEQLGAKPCLAYGTLLGAIRDNRFIAHDDDVDIIIELPGNNMSAAEALVEHERIAAQLDTQKYIVNRATKSGANLNLHVYVIKTGVLIDLFPYWYNQDQAMLHMEKMNIRGMPAEIMHGRSSVRLYDYDMPIPANAASFLAERYGEGWETPDKFHEWPWKLEN